MTDNKVTLCIYDLSNGMAASFGAMLVGKAVEAIYHTSLVVFGKEFYFSGGICYDPPFTTAFGRPWKTVEMGATELTAQDLFEYLKSIKDKFSCDTYHIFENNCNHFTNDVCEFLTGSPIPEYIVGQSKEYQNTPIGKFIEGMQVNANANRDNYNISYDGFNAQNQGLSQPQPQSNPQQGSGVVREVNGIMQYMELLSANKKIIVDFYADWCGPCRNIKPRYEELARQYEGKVLFCKVNVDNNQDVALNVNVTAMPTFLLYNDGKEVRKIQGANEAEIRKALELLNNS